MSTLLLAQYAARLPEHVSEADGDDVRSTVTTADRDAPEAMAPSAPDFNAVLVDARAEGGLTTTQLASHVTPSRQGAPVADTSARDAAVADVDRSNSQGGHAPARELTGEWGHGTLKVVEGIEPAIREGGRFDGTYFVADNRHNAAGNYMSATRAADDRTQAIGEARSGDAVTASQGSNDMFAAFLAATTGAVK